MVIAIHTYTEVWMINFTSVPRSEGGGHALYLMSGTGVDMGLLQVVLEAVRWGDMTPVTEAFMADQLGRVRDEVVRLEGVISAPIIASVNTPLLAEGRIADIDRLIKLRAMIADPNQGGIYFQAWERLSRAMEAAQSGAFRASYPVQLRGDTSPALLKLLNIDAGCALDRMTIAHVLRNRTADGGAIPGKHYAVDRRSGTPTGFFALVFTPSKTVSMAWERNPERRGAIIAAHNAAVDVVMRGIERDIGWVRSGSGGKERGRGATTWITFLHGTSRMGDPDLHSHVAMLNVVLREDGKVGGLDTWRWHGQEPKHRAEYHRVLAGELIRAGFDAYYSEVGYPEAIIRGLHPEAKREFSQRREQAVAKAREWAPLLDQLPSKVRASLINKAAYVTRPAQGKHAGGEDVWAKKWGELEAKWARERISEANRALGRIKAGLEHGYNVGGSRDLEWGMER